MTLRGLVPRIETLIDRALYGMTLLLLVLLAISMTAMVQHLQLSVFAISQLPGVLLFQLVGSVIALVLVRRQRRNLAAWLLFGVSAVAGPVSAAQQPSIAIFTLIVVLMVVMVSVPHVSQAGLIVMGALGTLSIGVAMYLGGLSDSSGLSGPLPALMRVGALTAASGFGIAMFALLYQRTLIGLRELDAANAALHEAQTRLQTEIAERTRAEEAQRRHNTYLGALNDIATVLVLRHEQQPLLREICERAGALLNAQHTFVSLLNAAGDAQQIVLSLDLNNGTEIVDRFSIPRGRGLIGQAWETGQLAVMGHYEQWSERLEKAPKGVSAAAVMPLKVGENVIGSLGFAFGDPNRVLNNEELNIIERFARLVSVVLENTRLHEAAHGTEAMLQLRVSERTAEINRLLAITHNLASSLDMRELLPKLFDELGHIVPFQTGTFFLVSGPGEMSVVHAAGNMSSRYASTITWPIRLHYATIYQTQQPLVIDDIMGDTLEARQFRQLGAELKLPKASGHITSWLGVPVKVNEKVIGILALGHDARSFYTEQHALLALSVAQQAGLAIENSRLHMQSLQAAVQAAAHAERSRLARDLHDSVSQAVFSMALGTRTMQQLAEVAPERVLEPLPHVVSMAEAALTEIRALIFELRPESLQEEGLLAALRKHTASLRTRHGLQVIEDFPGAEPDLPIDVKEALYRVSLEAMHNVVKHARAKRLALSVSVDAGTVQLRVEDNGGGFDQASVPAGHYGLKTMRERITQFGGVLCVDSAAGAGTRVIVSIPIDVRPTSSGDPEDHSHAAVLSTT